MTIKFFDVYSSPIVHSFFYSYVEKSCLINPPDKIDFNTRVNRVDTNYLVNRDRVMYSTRIDNHTVIFNFTIQEDKTYLSFDIDYTFKRNELPRLTKFKIIKWLLAVWAIEQHKSAVFICSPCKEGGDWRGDYYKRFNFKWVNDKDMKLIK